MTQQHTKKHALIAKAEHITGHALTLSGMPKVTIRRADDNKPVSELLVRFVTSSMKYEVGSAYTNEEGIAEVDSGIKLNPLFVGDALIAGYDAIFDGDEKRLPITAHGTVTPWL